MHPGPPAFWKYTSTHLSWIASGDGEAAAEHRAVNYGDTVYYTATSLLSPDVRMSMTHIQISGKDICDQCVALAAALASFGPQLSSLCLEDFTEGDLSTFLGQLSHHQHTIAFQLESLHIKRGVNVIDPYRHGQCHWLADFLGTPVAANLLLLGFTCVEWDDRTVAEVTDAIERHTSLRSLSIQCKRLRHDRASDLFQRFVLHNKRLLNPHADMRFHSSGLRPDFCLPLCTLKKINLEFHSRFDLEISLLLRQILLETKVLTHLELVVGCLIDTDFDDEAISTIADGLRENVSVLSFGMFAELQLNNMDVTPILQVVRDKQQLLSQLSPASCSIIEELAFSFDMGYNGLNLLANAISEPFSHVRVIKLRELQTTKPTSPSLVAFLQAIQQAPKLEKIEMILENVELPLCSVLPSFIANSERLSHLTIHSTGYANVDGDALVQSIIRVLPGNTSLQDLHLENRDFIFRRTDDPTLSCHRNQSVAQAIDAFRAGTLPDATFPRLWDRLRGDSSAHKRTLLWLYLTKRLTGRGDLYPLGKLGESNDKEDKDN